MTDKEENLVRLAVYVSEEKRARFKAACAIQRISMNQVIGDFLDEWLKENDQPNSPTLASTGVRGRGRTKEKDDKSTTTG